MASPDVSFGVDFGTTNSSVAVASPSVAVTLARFPTTPSFRSLLFFERDARKQTRAFTGPQAIDRYLGAESHEGRLIQSLKSYLPARSLTGTEIFGRRYSVEDLLARIVGDLRRAAERFFSCEITRAVVGRPVRFVGAQTPEDDAFAESRLLEACRRAGFAEVHFEYEPVGAALAYASTLMQPETVLIGDFGGGTSDFSLLRLAPGARAQVLGTSGVGLAGDAFDAKLVRHLVAPALGSETLERSGAKLLPAVPAWIYANLERWHYLSFLRTRNVAEILKGAQVRALEPGKIEALRTLIEDDLGFRLHAAVEQLKYALSEQERAEFRFREPGLELSVPVTRAEFEGWIAPELAAIAGAVDELLAATGTAPAQVDQVFLTGGTSFVPAVERIFATRFTPGRVLRGEAFTAVAYGLALRARELAGELRRVHQG